MPRSRLWRTQTSVAVENETIWKERSYLILNTPSNNALWQKLVFVVKQTNIDKNCQTAAGSVTEHRHS